MPHSDLKKREIIIILSISYPDWTKDDVGTKGSIGATGVFMYSVHKLQTPTV